MREIRTDEFQQEVIKSIGPVAVIFTAPWCSFCDSMMKIAEAVEKEIPDAKIFKIDVGLERELAAKYTVSTVPATIIFSAGTIKERKTGLLKKSELFTMLSKAPVRKETHR